MVFTTFDSNNKINVNMDFEDDEDPKVVVVCTRKDSDKIRFIWCSVDYDSVVFNTLYL